MLLCDLAASVQIDGVRCFVWERLSCPMKGAFLLGQNVTLAAVPETDPVADRAPGCPCYEKTALC